MTDHEAAGQAAVSWACNQLGDPAAQVEPLRSRPWSATWRIRSAGATCILKATGPASHYEAPLMRHLSQCAPSFVPAVLGSDDDHGWLLLAHAGPTLRDLRHEHGREPLLARFARLQRAAEPLVETLLAAGVPDERPQQLGPVLDRLLAESLNLRGLDRFERDELRRRPARWQTELDLLGQLPAVASIQHGDLHDNNVAAGPDGVSRFFDFGDASIAHPFMTMLMPLHIASTEGASRADLTRMRAAYLGQFTDLAPLPDLHRVLDAALRLAWLLRATAWDRALIGAPDGHPWGDPVPDTLRELVTALR